MPIRSRFRRLGRYWRLHLAVLLLATLVGAELLLAYQTTVANQLTDTSVASIQTVLDVTTATQAALVDMETGYRGYLLTGQDAFLDPYVTGRGIYEADLQQLEQLTAASPSQEARWQRIEQLAAAWQQDVTEPTIAYRRALAGQPGALDQVGAIVASQGGKARMDQIRDVFAEAIGAEQATLQAERQQQAQSDARLVAVLVWGTLAAALVALALGGWILRSLEQERLSGVRLAIQTAEHELYNRLTIASGNVQLLEREPNLASYQHDWAVRARASIDGATAVVRHLRELPALREVVWPEARVVTIDFSR